MIPLILPGGDLTQEVLRGDAWPEAVHHLLRVRRVRPGEILQIGDGAGQRVQATVASHDKKDITLTDIRALPAVAAPGTTLWLCCLEKSALEEALHLVCQVGIAGIRLVASEFTVAPAPRDKDRARLEKIVLNSCIQSEQAWLPTLDFTPVLFADLALDATWFAAIERHTHQTPTTTTASHIEAPQVATCQILIGPEGGWSATEREKLLTSEAHPLDLGTSILRAQTAALIACWHVAQHTPS